MLRHGYGYWLDDNDDQTTTATITVMRDWHVTGGSYDVISNKLLEIIQ
jgi:hypothetical protein